ncbi:MAG: NADH-quinone oxidoreductase subunit C [Candidatus Hecatellaceae archaeon]
MVSIEEAVEKLKQGLGPENVLEVKLQPPRHAFVLIKTEKLKEAVSYILKELGFQYVITISGVDLIKQGQFEVIYHLSDYVNTISLRVRIPRDNPKVPTITDIIPGATLYEREVHDMFGIVAEGHPNLAKLLLSDGWPEDLHPLRKDVTIQQIRERLEEERKKGVKGI